MKKTALLLLLAVAPVFAQQQQPRFEAADVRVSPTAPGFGQNFGGVLREGRYVNRDATLLNLISSAYGVVGGQHRRRPRLDQPRSVRCHRTSV